ncbi:MAG: tetratricopeptide repeat protein [Paludibacter sp.]|nr:tetratricopeptide repeat protein [Paludibacter sp.]
MSKKLSAPVDDESREIIRRYELYLEGEGSGYFDVEELEAIVDYYLYKGRTKDGSKAIDLGLKLHPGSMSLKAKRAKIYLAVGDTQKAYRIITSVSDSGDYEFSLLKIEAFSRMGRDAEANVLCQNLIAETTDDLDNVCLDIAFIYISQLGFEQAVYYLKRGDKFNEFNADLLFELAFCYEQLSENDKAIDVYNRILNIDSFMSEAWFNLGQIYFAKQEFMKAIEAYDFALAINPDDTLTSLQKAHAHFQLGQYTEAIDAYHEYESMTDDHWQSNLFVGECYEKLERYDDAIAFYKKSLDEKAENYDALTGIAVCLLEKDQYAESISYIKKAIDIQENAHDAWVYLAEALVGMDDIENALLAYLKSIAIEPNQPDTLMAIANICMDKGEYQTALQYYLTAYDMDKTLEYIDLFIAIAFHKNDNDTAAVIYLKKAQELNLDAIKMFYEICPDAGPFSI